MSDHKPLPHADHAHDHHEHDPNHDDDHVHGPDCQHDHHHHVHVETYRRDLPKIGRNDPCYCGSGKKFKKCHGNA